ncbi:hypothetical protein T07_2141 [Trichinella nelsoni]|uniref:Uncharacterized protein n=6 Tax=Trichinella TaxID=6333 RepID=A0A0V0S4E9_9BILA|nr:hypothetical protein T07_2141 [Trichinella nelsoni]
MVYLQKNFSSIASDAQDVKFEKIFSCRKASCGSMNEFYETWYNGATPMNCNGSFFFNYAAMMYLRRSSCVWILCLCCFFCLYSDFLNVQACGSFSTAKRSNYQITALFDSPLPSKQKDQIENLVSALKSKPIQTTYPGRTIHIQDSGFPTRKSAECKIRVNGPPLGTTELMNVEEVIRSQVNILVRPNSVRSIQITPV